MKRGIYMGESKLRGYRFGIKIATSKVLGCRQKHTEFLGRAACVRNRYHYCMKKIQCWIVRYVIFQFWDKTDAERDTYLRFRSRSLYLRWMTCLHFFDNKDNLMKFKIIGRDFIELRLRLRTRGRGVFTSRKGGFLQDEGSQGMA